MKNLILIFVPIILLSSCFNKNMEETKSGSLNTGNTETNTGEVERKSEMYGDIEIIDFPANQIEKLDKLPYPILSDKEPICKNGEQKVKNNLLNFIVCLPEYYNGCGGMGCGNGNINIDEDYSDTYINYKRSNDSKINFYELPDLYIDNKSNNFSKIYSYDNILIIDYYNKNSNLYFYTNIYLKIDDKYFIFEYNKENPDTKRFLETLYINK